MAPESKMKGDSERSLMGAQAAEYATSLGVVSTPSNGQVWEAQLIDTWKELLTMVKAS